MRFRKLQLNEISSLSEWLQPATIFDAWFIDIFIQKLIIVYRIAQFKLDESDAFEVSAEHFVMVQHQFLRLNRKLFI
jgi:hypothetical protein